MPSTIRQTSTAALTFAAAVMACPLLAEAGMLAGLNDGMFWYLAPVLIPILGVVWMMLLATGGLSTSNWRGIHRLNALTCFFMLGAILYMLAGFVFKLAEFHRHERAILAASVVMAVMACVTAAVYWPTIGFRALVNREPESVDLYRHLLATIRTKRVFSVVFVLWFLASVSLPYLVAHGFLMVLIANVTAFVAMMCWRRKAKGQVRLF